MATTADSATSADLGGTATTDEPRARRGAGARAKTLAIGRAILFVLVGAAIGYVLGRVQGGYAVRDAESRLTDQSAASAAALEASEREHEQAIAQAQTARARVETRAAQLATALELHRGALSIARARAALDARNFGTAEQHVREAEQALRAIAAAHPDVEPVARALAETRIVVAGDLEEQRSRLRTLGQSLDDALARTSPTSLDAAQDTTAGEIPAQERYE